MASGNPEPGTSPGNDAAAHTDPLASGPGGSQARKHLTAVPLLALIVMLDIVTKQWALRALGSGERMELFGGIVPLTLAFNKGAAFSLNVGDASRWIFLALSTIALFILLTLYRHTQAGDHARILALTLVGAGALGNLIDRVRWSRGVVDFIGPIDLGFMHWPIFNVADMAITTGAALLMISLWREERGASRSTAPTSSLAAENETK